MLKQEKSNQSSILSKKKDCHSPRSEKCGRLRRENGRSTPKKENERAKIGASPATKEDGRAPSAPTEAGARSGQNACARRASPGY